LETEAEMKRAAEGKNAELMRELEDIRTQFSGVAKGMSEGLKHGVEHGRSKLELESIEAYDPEAEAKFKISHSVYITNFPDNVNSRDLWRECSVYGTVVDVFIPFKKSKAGKRFAFVRFIKVFNLDRLVKNLCTLWIGKYHLFANQVRYDRPHKSSVHKSNFPPLNGMNKVQRPRDKSLGSKQVKEGMGSYISVVNGTSPPVYPGSLISSAPALVLNDVCIVERDFSRCVMGKVKDFDSIPNLQSILADEGFENANLSYLGGLWVMFEFDKVESKTKMMNHIGINSWFQVIQEVIQDFVSKERKVYMVRAKELFTWNPTFETSKEKDYSSDEESVRGKDGQDNRVHVNEEEEGELNTSNGEDVVETVFGDNSSLPLNQNACMGKQHSKDPFELYELLEKKKHEEEILEPSPSLSHPPGFSPVGSVNLRDDVQVMEVNTSQRSKEFSPSISAKVMNNAQVVQEKTRKEWVKELTNTNKINFIPIQETKMEKVSHMDVKFMWGNSNYDYVFSESVGNSGGILCIWEESIFKKSYVPISDSFVAIYGTWIPNKTKVLIVAIYLSLLLSRWNGEAVLMGDFNEVRIKDERRGTWFNSCNASFFNKFISSSGLVDIKMKGYAFTWSHPSGKKMSKLDRFLASDGFISLFPSIMALCMDHHLSNHRTILLCEVKVDFGPIPFWFYHSWFKFDGFDDMVEHTWHSFSFSDNNSMIRLKKKLQELKKTIRQWIKIRNSHISGFINSVSGELRDIDIELEQIGANDSLIFRRHELICKLNDLKEMAAMDSFQKSKVRWAIEGDKNSKYFHGIINKKRSHLAIRGVFDEGTWHTDPTSVVDLERGVSHDEIRAAVWDCGDNKSPGPDGFTFEFFRRYWKFIGPDFCEAVEHFFDHNSSFISLIPKILANRLAMVIADLVSDTQSAFVAKRQILDGPFILNEVLHWCKRKNKQAMFFKVNFAKAYDSYRWDFLINVLEAFGFGSTWCNWIRGDPSYLFILVMESSHLSVNRAVGEGVFKGIRLNGSLSLSHFFYADDALFMGEWSDSNMKGCSIMENKFCYLGVMVGEKMYRRKAWDDVVLKLRSRLSRWKAKTLSIGGRLTLLKSILGASPLYNMSIFKVPKGVLKEMESIRRGLGVSSYFALNRSLLFKWVWRFVSQDGFLWFRVIHVVHGNSIDAHLDQNLSIWSSILKEVQSLKSIGFDFLSHCSKRIGDGSSTSFWLETWKGDKPLRETFPRLFALELNRDINVTTKLYGVVNASFRRPVRGGVEQQQLSDLCSILDTVILSPAADRWYCSLSSDGVFSVKEAQNVIDDLILPSYSEPTRTSRSKLIFLCGVYGVIVCLPGIIWFRGVSCWSPPLDRCVVQEWRMLSIFFFNARLLRRFFTEYVVGGSRITRIGLLFRNRKLGCLLLGFLCTASATNEGLVECKASTSNEGLAECTASASNLRRIQVKDIIKEVEDYLKTYSLAGMDISLKSIIISCLPNGVMKSVIKCATAKAMWSDLILAHEGSSDTRDTKIVALRIKFNAFKAFEGEKVNGTFTRLKYLLNDLENNGVSISQTKDSDSDVEEDQKSNSEFLPDLNVEFHERALLANQKRLYKRNSENGLVAESFDWDEESVSFEDEGVTKVKAFIVTPQMEPGRNALLTVAIADTTQSLEASESIEELSNQTKPAGTEKGRRIEILTFITKSPFSTNNLMHVQETIVEEAENIVEEKEDDDLATDSGIRSLGNVTFAELYGNTKESRYDTSLKSNVKHPELHDDRIEKEFSNYDEATADNVIEELIDIANSQNAALNASTEKPSQSDPLGHYPTDLSLLVESIKNLEYSLSQKMAGKINESMPRMVVDALEERLPEILSDSLKTIVPNLLIDFVKQVLPKFDKQLKKTLNAQLDKNDVNLRELINMIRDLVLMIDVTSASSKAAPEGENMSTQENKDSDIKVPTPDQGEQQQIYTTTAEEAMENAQGVQSSYEAPLISEHTPPISTALVVQSSEEEPIVKKLKFILPDFTIPSPQPLNSIMSQGIRPPVIINSIPFDQFTINLVSSSSSEFSLTPCQIMEEIKRLVALKLEKEESEKRLKKMMTPAEMEDQAKQLAAYEAKRAKMLEEYNHCINFRVDPLRITKISYRVNNSTKEACIRITRNNQPLNLIMYDKFVLKMLEFSEWLETHAGKLGISPPPQLTAFGLSTLEKKKKRSYEFTKKVFVKEDIVMDRIHRNLVPPLGILPLEGLVISEPESRIFYYNGNFDLVFQRESEFHLATPPQLIRIHNAIKVNLEIAD
nr:RNA-directed DNA polymerase, eukaryota [Tanacetum cinerariifolium]